MDNPPGAKNCHFIDTIHNKVGPRGVNIVADKEFDEEAEWQHLEGMLNSQVTEEIADRVRIHIKNCQGYSNK